MYQFFSLAKEPTHIINATGLTTPVAVGLQRLWESRFLSELAMDVADQWTGKEELVDGLCVEVWLYQKLQAWDEVVTNSQIYTKWSPICCFCQQGRSSHDIHLCSCCWPSSLPPQPLLVHVMAVLHGVLGCYCSGERGRWLIFVVGRVAIVLESRWDWSCCITTSWFSSMIRKYKLKTQTSDLEMSK